MKGFFDLEENCKEKIISEDYWDFIIPLYRDEELKEVNPENACIQEMDFGYKSVSVDRRILLPCQADTFVQTHCRLSIRNRGK